MSILELSCDVDDFMQAFLPFWQEKLLSTGAIKRIRKPQLCESEIMTIMIPFHQPHYRDFKAYYIRYVQKHLCTEFPKLVSYNRFVELMPRVLIPMLAYLDQKKGDCTGISIVDSTPLKVCHNRRIARHKVFTGLAKRGKTSMGWFYGFKLHLVVNDQGDLLACRLTPGNVDDRQPVPQMTKELFGKLFGDKGYLSQPLFEQLFEQGLELIPAIL